MLVLNMGNAEKKLFSEKTYLTRNMEIASHMLCPWTGRINAWFWFKSVIWDGMDVDTFHGYFKCAWSNSGSEFESPRISVDYVVWKLNFFTHFINWFEQCWISINGNHPANEVLNIREYCGNFGAVNLFKIFTEWLYSVHNFRPQIYSRWEFI